MPPDSAPPTPVSDRVRHATALDAPGIGALKVRAWRAAYGSFMSRALLDSLDPAEDAARWAEYLSDIPADHRLWVSEAAGGVTGFCRTGPTDARRDADLGGAAAEVHGLYIDPARIGTGLGRALFAHAVTDLERRGHGPVCVYAYTPNTTAVRFYERAGFTADGTTRLDPDDGIEVPEVRLVKR
ncbi:N-acetyltransferase [Streptomyces triticagri]|uniref:N-acetyltransferase n=1 Tax=Streptomyces triticagri TaxID=2293568 RepID=A0A372MA91_9ACTN|nr:GNAT family N-acetyltransferase [Streptomyces triticagri]RFU87868.1 N-acetyltransferase [Streptomyces triticagri]